MLFDIKNSRTAPDDIADAIEPLERYQKILSDIVNLRNYEEKESSLLLPSDHETYEEVLGIKNTLCGDSLKYVFVIGIGGSNLGTKAIYDALLGHFDAYDKDRFPKIFFLDTSDTKTLQKTLTFLNILQKEEEFLVNIVTKSGGTTETIANAEIVLGGVLNKFNDEGLKRVVITSDAESLLTKSAKEKGIHTLSIPPLVGGRFSVFSAVGLFPLLCVGIDVEALLQGASDMLGRSLDESISKNIAMQSATVLYLLRRKGKIIHTSFIFHPELKSLGDWYRQLLAESIGKLEDEKGNTVHTGITPEVSIGSTDLHSVAQLYLGGPKDKVTTFITVQKIGGIVSIPDERVFKNVIPSISGKTAEEIMKAILDGTKKAYIKGELPFMEAILEEVSAYEIGQFMQFKMCEIMYLAKLLNIDAFNQPSVEDYKVETKKILDSL